MSLKKQDPDLFQLLSGSASAELELAALEGSLPEVAVPAEQREAQAKAARVQEILAQHPGGSLGRYETNADGQSVYIEGTAPRLDLLMELATLDPQAHAQQELIRKGPQPEPSAADQAQAAASAAAQRVESLNHANSLLGRGL